MHRLLIVCALLAYLVCSVRAMSTASPGDVDNNSTDTTTLSASNRTTTTTDPNGITLTGYRKWCYAHTDVHYHTFDYAYFDYQGLCKHQLLSVCDNGACNRDFALPQFEIYFKGETRYGSWPVSYPLYVEIHYQGTQVRLTRQLPYGVTATWLNGPSPGATIGPGSYAGFQLTSYWYDSYIYTGPPGLTVYFGSRYAFISLDMIYWNSTCGMCGNNNFNLNDDYCTQDGVCPSSGEAIGDSWVVNDPEDPSSTCSGPSGRKRRQAVDDDQCPRRRLWEKRCRKLLETQSGFLDSKFMRHELQECVFDACNSDGAALTDFEEFLAFYVKLSEDNDDVDGPPGGVAQGTCSRNVFGSNDSSSKSSDDSNSD